MANERDRVLSMLGMAARAGKVVSGEFAVEQNVKNQKATLVFVAVDASENTKKMFHDMCAFYQTKMLVYGTKEALGQAIGKEFRASVAVLDQGFADAIEKLTDQKR